jgi:hypothetical protein
MILTLSVYPSRTPDLLSWDRMRIDPAIPVNTYHDSFGNLPRHPSPRGPAHGVYRLLNAGQW